MRDNERPMDTLPVENYRKNHFIHTSWAWVLKFIWTWFVFHQRGNTTFRLCSLISKNQHNFQRTKIQQLWLSIDCHTVHNWFITVWIWTTSETAEWFKIIYEAARFMKPIVCLCRESYQGCANLVPTNRLQLLYRHNHHHCRHDPTNVPGDSGELLLLLLNDIITQKGFTIYLTQSVS